jgi:spore maturation protein SpmA
MKETIEYIYSGWENVVITFALIGWVGFWCGLVTACRNRGRARDE